MGKGITETLYWFYNLVLFYACGRFYASTPTIRQLLVLFYTTVRFHASTFIQLTSLLHHWMILRIYDVSVYADWQFCFIHYVSTHLRFSGSFCFYTTGRFYASTMLLYADRQFCFTPLYVSTHLRFYGSLWVYTTVRFYASTMLRYADCQFCFIPLYVSTAHFSS